MDDIYEQLGVPRVINAAGTLTRIGGTLMWPQVTEAMVEASKSFVRIEELQEAASQIISSATGAEAGYVRVVLTTFSPDCRINNSAHA